MQDVSEQLFPTHTGHTGEAATAKYQPLLHPATSGLASRIHEVIDKQQLGSTAGSLEDLFLYGEEFSVIASRGLDMSLGVVCVACERDSAGHN
jgi:hypothetical protein